MAGGSAGGIVMAGGSAGGIGGGSAGGTVMQDTYVCGSCANALDTNPGTQAQPVRTIGRGLQLAVLLGRPTVFVGTAQGAPVTYTENLTVPAGVVVQGRWSVSGTFAWTRTAPRSLLVNTQPNGVTFAAGATRTTGLDGLTVRSASLAAGTAASSAITIIDASPLIFDTNVEVATSGGAPGTAVGIVVSRSPTAVRPNPRIAGVNDASRANITSGAAVVNSIGIAVQDASVELEFLNVQSGTAVGLNSGSAAIQMNNGARSIIRNLQAFPGLASQGACGGITANGDSSGLLIDTVVARGCPAANGTPALASLGVGFGSCPLLTPGGAAPQLINSTVSAGLAQGNGSWVIGVLATNGCAPVINGNTVSGTASLTVVAQNAVAIGCTHESNGMPGTNAACRITNNRATSGRATAIATGISCIGNCAAGDATCLGSCAEVSTNTVSAGDAPVVIHGSITQSSPRIARNTFGEAGATCNSSGPGGGSITALRLEGSGSRVENNVLLAGNCGTLYGLEQINSRRAIGFAPGPDVHSNTVIPAQALSGIASATIVGVSIRSPGGPVLVPALGTYRNNIIIANGTATVRFAFREADANSDPAVLENNDFWAPAIVGMPLLYQDEGTMTLNAASQINMLNGLPGVSAGALSADPAFTLGSTFRLSGGSPMRNAGVTTGMPRDDFDGTARPAGGNAPDVGADEVQ